MECAWYKTNLKKVVKLWQVLFSSWKAIFPCPIPPSSLYLYMRGRDGGNMKEVEGGEDSNIAGIFLLILREGMLLAKLLSHEDNNSGIWQYFQDYFSNISWNNLLISGKMNFFHPSIDIVLLLLFSIMNIYISVSVPSLEYEYI